MYNGNMLLNTTYSQSPIHRSELHIPLPHLISLQGFI